MKRVDFNAIVDHLALRHIIKSKAKPATMRIKRLLQLFSSYPLNLYYMEGKDMILSNFLSRQMHDNSNLHEIIPLSFNMYNTLYKTCYRIELKDEYLVQTCSQTKAIGISLPEVHGAKKMLVTNMPLEKQKSQIKVKQVDKNRPKLGRGRAGMWCKNPEPVADTLVSTNKSPKIPTIQKVAKDSTDFSLPEQLKMTKTETITRRQIKDKNREQHFHWDPFFRPPPKPPGNLWPRKSKN